MDAKNEAFEFAILEHLGPAALIAESLSPYEIFRLGWEAALAQPAQGEPIGRVHVLENDGEQFIELLLYKNKTIAEGSEVFTQQSAPPSAPAIEAAAYMRAAEVCRAAAGEEGRTFEGVSEEILALLPQDGRTALRNLIGAGIEYGARGEWPMMATMEQLIDRILAENGLTDIGVPPLKLKEPPNEPT